MRLSPLTPESATSGVPSAPKATGAVLAISEKPEACNGLKPMPIRRAAVTATGVPKPQAPSKNAPKAKGDQDELEAAVLGDAHEALLEDFEVAGFAR